MKPIFLLIIVTLVTIACQSNIEQENQTKEGDHPGLATYQSHCASCHGIDLAGNSATALIKKDWLYGRGTHLMRRNVKYGIQDGEMPAFEHILDDDAIKNVVDFVLAAQTEKPTIERAIPPEVATKDYQLTVEEVDANGVLVPWAIEFVNEDRALISERGGDLHWLIDGKLDTTKIEGLPIPHTGSSTGGFMDIALDPNYAQNGWVYLAFSHTDEDPKSKEANALTKIVRGQIRDHQWHSEETLFEAPDSLRVVKGNRWGCRLLFDDAGFLYFTIGDMAQAMDSQDLGKATGKVFRIHPDGSIPADNPFVDNPEALPAIFTIGNRNTQGLAIHPITKEIWSTDHGPMGGDELNILHKGANYGWPIITYGRDYSGDTVSVLTHQEGMEQPVIQWSPSIAACAATFVTSPLFPDWQNHLLVGALAFEELRLLRIENDQVVDQELILKNRGRVREVKFSPDGVLYVLLNKPDKIIKIIPKQVIG